MSIVIIGLAVVLTLVTLAILFPAKRKACLNKAKDTVKGLKEMVKSMRKKELEPVAEAQTA